MTSLPEKFRIFLIGQKLSISTVKNYVADINHFLTWLKVNSGINHQIVNEKIFALFTPEIIKKYQQSLITAKIPANSIKRHLSALRKFGNFAQSQNWLKNNSAQEISPTPFPQSNENENQDLILEEFNSFLKKERVSPLTRKNYLADIRHFLSWLEVN